MGQFWPDESLRKMSAATLLKNWRWAVERYFCATPDPEGLRIGGLASAALNDIEAEMRNKGIDVPGNKAVAKILESTIKKMNL